MWRQWPASGDGLRRSPPTACRRRGSAASRDGVQAASAVGGIPRSVQAAAAGGGGARLRRGGSTPGPQGSRVARGIARIWASVEAGCLRGVLREPGARGQGRHPARGRRGRRLAVRDAGVVPAGLSGSACEPNREREERGGGWVGDV